MKPIVIYLDKHDDEIKLTRKEFEEYINKAYDQGYACGYAEGKKYYPWWGNSGITYTQTNVPREITYGTGKKYDPNDTQITCNTIPQPKEVLYGTTTGKTATNSVYTGDNAVTDSTIPEAVSKILQELGERK